MKELSYPLAVQVTVNENACITCVAGRVSPTLAVSYAMT